MLTYDFQDMHGETLYEYLCRKIRSDILEGRLSPGERMPSRRALAGNLGVSTITVENTYAQLVAEGYLYARPRQGYFVTQIRETLLPAQTDRNKQAFTARRDRGETAAAAAGSGGREAAPDAAGRGVSADVPVTADLVSGRMDTSLFPFTIWARLMRRQLSEHREALLERSPGAGVTALREAIAQHLRHLKGMDVRAEQVVVGAGTEYLCDLLLRLLGPRRRWAMEMPGYRKSAQVLEGLGADVVRVPMDEEGLRIDALRESGADVVFITPTHQFPTGITMPIRRRLELLEWAAAGRWIIEDDPDGQLHLSGRPLPTLMSRDRGGRVIYLGTFTRTLAPTIRIAYLILPETLLPYLREKLWYSSCTVSNFEQYTMADFIRDGCYEKHVARLQTRYRAGRETFLTAFAQSPLAATAQLEGAQGGLHFLMHLPGEEADLERRARAAGIRIEGLTACGAPATPGQATMILNGPALPPADLGRLPARLAEAWGIN